MTIRVNIGEDGTRLPELISAAMRGEDVVLAKAGDPQVRLVRIADDVQGDKDAIVARRLATLGIWKGRVS